ncbi:hypothetical protein MTR67_023557 [Solanum verrucosum]|uniref:Reverse transcriptase domain-containing protein n=1 Tax=Solanum verrucosum TaxID=315347 RepID=A0AAF0TRH7_SOLVR|nr:hypothetical protein MTR67_023557 [Solanum verrucosum]
MNWSTTMIGTTTSKTIKFASLAMLTIDRKEVPSLAALNTYDLVDKVNPLTNLQTLAGSLGTHASKAHRNGPRTQGTYSSTASTYGLEETSLALPLAGATLRTYKGFNMEARGPQINHLCFADDVIIFTSTTRRSLQLIMKTLSTYEAILDQCVDKEKSHFMIPTNATMETIERIKEITGFSQQIAL